VSTESAIEEEYSQDFSDSVLKDDSIIEEDFPKSSSHSASASLRKPGARKGSGSSKVHIPGSAKSKPRMEESDSIVEEMIEEDSLIKEAEDSIKEESIANEVDSYRSDRKKSSESIAEDSAIKEEYENDNFASYNAA